MKSTRVLIRYFEYTTPQAIALGASNVIGSFDHSWNQYATTWTYRSIVHLQARMFLKRNEISELSRREFELHTTIRRLRDVCS